MLRRSIKNLRESQYTKGRDTMSMRRKLHEEELTLQEKIEKICNDKDLFKENFWNLRLSEVYIECGQDLEEFANDTEWWGEKFFKFIKYLSTFFSYFFSINFFFFHFILHIFLYFKTNHQNLYL